MEYSESFNRYMGDDHVALASLEEDFVRATHDAKFTAAIFHRKLSADLEDFVKTQRSLSELATYSHPVIVDWSDRAFPTVRMQKSFPEPLVRHISDRALLLSAITGRNKLSLLFGNPRNTKLHYHVVPTFVGSLINKGTQWEISENKFGTVEQGDDFYIPPGFYHRSTPIADDEERLIWALSAIS